MNMGFLGKMYTMIMWAKISEQKMKVISNLKKIIKELGIEQLVMWLLDKKEGPSWIPRNHIQIQGIVLCIYSPSNSDAQIPKAFWYLTFSMKPAVSTINVDSVWSLTQDNSVVFICTQTPCTYILIHVDP